MTVKEPTCSLCQGSLTQERAVQGEMFSYTLAWVCKDCSAVFPIAVGTGKVLGKPKPLYTGGKRFNAKAS
jgi:hypothetical protein